MVTLRVRFVSAFPAKSKASKANVFVGEVTGKRTVQPEMVVQVRGMSWPLMWIVFTSTGAVPLRVTRLLLVVMEFVPLMAKGALPPALLIRPLSKIARLAI